MPHATSNGFPSVGRLGSAPRYVPIEQLHIRDADELVGSTKTSSPLRAPRVAFNPKVRFETSGQFIAAIVEHIDDIDQAVSELAVEVRRKRLSIGVVVIPKSFAVLNDSKTTRDRSRKRITVVTSPLDKTIDGAREILEKYNALLREVN
jgi:hypothetical protein